MINKLRKGIGLLITVMLVMQLAGCAALGIPGLPGSDKNSSSSSSSSSKPIKTPEAVIEVIPDPDAEVEDKAFLNELEELDNTLLLPLAINVPDKVPQNTPTQITIGSDFTITPNESWTMKVTKDMVQFFHVEGICLQLTAVKTKAKFEAPQIKTELKAFYDSFLEKDEPVLRQAFIGTKLSGQETGFQIEHNARPLVIKAGVITKSSESLIWTVNYYADGNTSVVAEQLIATLLNTLHCGSDAVTLQ